jgi:hypothetical protein
MKTHTRRTVLSLALVPILTTLPVQAVIVAGTSGTGNNNNTQSGLNSYLSGASLAAFPYWNNLVRVSNSSGVYLGFNASTQRGWVLSADHIGPEPTTITVAGNTYTVAGTVTKIGSSDLTLYQIGGISDPPMPSLPIIPLLTTLASIGEQSLMFGRASTSSTSSPFPWVLPGTSESNGNRWGSNTVELTALVNIGTIPSPNIQPYVVVDFDGPLDPGATAFDAQGAAGDSGGGLFVLRGGVWQLAGIAHFVDDGPDFLEGTATGDGVTDPSQHGDFTAYSDVATKRSAINGFTGFLIPEPSAFLLAAPAFLLLLRRRRCETCH